MAPRRRVHPRSACAHRRSPARRRGRVCDGDDRRRAVGRPDAAGAGRLPVPGPVVHRVRASAAPARVSRARRLSGSLPFLRRGKKLLPAADRRRIRHRLSAACPRRPCAARHGTQYLEVPALRDPQRLPRRDERRAAAGRVDIGPASPRALSVDAPWRRRSRRSALDRRRSPLARAAGLARPAARSVVDDP